MYIFLCVRKNYKYNKFFTQIANIYANWCLAKFPSKTKFANVINPIAKSKFFEMYI